MTKQELYELGAKNLAKRIQNTSDLVNKARIMTCIGNLRYSQYQNTTDKVEKARARRLAGNCYLAARHMGYRAAIEKLY